MLSQGGKIMDTDDPFAGECFRTHAPPHHVPRMLLPWTPRAIMISIVMGILAWGSASIVVYATLPHHIVRAELWRPLFTGELLAFVIAPPMMPRHWRAPRTPG